MITPFATTLETLNTQARVIFEWKKAKEPEDGANKFSISSTEIVSLKNMIKIKMPSTFVNPNLIIHNELNVCYIC